METEKLILDACCGSRMFWFDKQNPNVLFVDKRSETVTAKDRDRVRTIEVKRILWPTLPIFHLKIIPSTW